MKTEAYSSMALYKVAGLAGVVAFPFLASTVFDKLHGTKKEGTFHAQGDGVGDEDDPPSMAPEDKLETDADDDNALQNIAIPDHVLRHPRFGPSVDDIVQMHGVRKGHKRALVKHIDTMFHIFVDMQQIREDTPHGTELIHVLLGQMSDTRKRLMRRLSRIINSCGIPTVSGTNKLIDDNVHYHFAQIKLGCEEFMHNFNLLVAEKLELCVG